MTTNVAYNGQVFTIDRSKPLPEQFQQVLIDAGLMEPPEVPALPAPVNDDKKDDCNVCDLPAEEADTVADTTSELTLWEKVWTHKLGEAVIPVSLLASFLAMFPNSSANRVNQIADPATGKMVPHVRHVLVYDTYDNMKKLEGK